MTILRIIGIIITILELAFIFALAANNGFDSYFFIVFKKSLLITCVALFFGALISFSLLMIIEPQAIINLFKV